MKMSNKRIAAGVLALAFVFGGVGVPAANEAGLNFDIAASASEENAEIISSGTCGENLTWTLDDEGTLTISGKGEMTKARFRSPYINTVVIEDGVTSICSNAFQDCVNMASITIPNSVRSIGSAAFAFCSSLRSITIPNSVTRLESGTFDYCSRLTNINFPINIKSIGSFAYCTSLKSIDIPYGVESISGAFAYCTNLTSVNIPGSVKSIEKDTFTDCRALTSIIIPNGVKRIGEYAFKNCNALTSITIPDSVTSISYNSFDDFSKLKIRCYEGSFAEEYAKYFNIKYEHSEKYIGNCSIYFEPDYYKYDKTYIRVLQPDITIKEGTKTLTEGKDYTVVFPKPNDCVYPGYKDVTIKGLGDYYGEIVKTYCIHDFDILDTGTCGENLKWELTNNGKLTISGTGEMSDYDLYFECGEKVPWNRFRSAVKEVVIEDGVTSVGKSAFNFCENLTSIKIPNSITSIGDNAFINCSHLTSVKIPKSVTSIGNCAFDYCTSLTSIDIPDYGVTSIGDFAFYYCTHLKNITIPYSVTSIGKDAFVHCANLTSIYIPRGVTSIGASTFSGCYKLTKIDIPFSVTSIGDYAFSSCTSLTSIYIPDSVTSIGNGAFNNCKLLTNITIPNSVTSIGERTFLDCKALTSISIPDSVTSIEKYAFTRCTNLTSVTIPDSVTSIEYGTFMYCEALTSITIPDSVTSIGEYAFNGCTNLTSITIPDSVTNIERNSFTDCTSLTSITIPDSVTSIGEYAFKGCTSLTSITIPDSVTSIEKYAFTRCTNLTSITIPDSVTSIDSYAFLDCKALTSITIPKSVTKIGNNALGYSSNNGGYKKIDKFKIYCYKGSAAEKYAKDNGFDYELINWFVDGEDNWSFSNSRKNFGDSYYMNDDYWDTLLNGLCPTEKERMKTHVNTRWGGSCYGMALTSILECNDILDPAKYQSGAAVLYDISTPMTDEVKSVINYYHFLQFTEVIQQEIDNFVFTDEKEKINSLIECLKDGSPTMMCFSGGGIGHAVVAYGVEYGTYSYNNKTYDGKIITYDNNRIHYNDEYCLYFDSSDGSWTIPHYKLTTEGGSILGFVTDDINLLNNHGYINGTSYANTDDYIATLRSAAVEGDYRLFKSTYNYGSWISNTTSDDDIKVFSSLSDNDFKNSDLMFAMKDADSGYTFTTTNHEKLDLSLSYEKSLLMAEASNGTKASFSPAGYVEVSGSNTDFSLGMTYNVDYPTDWYTIHVSGNGVNKASLEKVTNGWIISADLLKNVIISTNNDTDSANIVFSTKYKKAFIYEVDKNTIGIKVDTDNNGTYESVLNPKTTAAPGEGSVKLTWDTVPGAEKYAICGYIGNKWQKLTESKSTSYVLDNLKFGKEYKIAVIAMTNGEWSKDFSNAITVTSKPAPNPYPIVTSEVSGNQFRLKWTTVKGAEKYGLAIYQSGKWLVKAQFAGNVTTYTSPKMNRGTYKMVVCAKLNGEWDISDINNRAITVTIA